MFCFCGFYCNKWYKSLQHVKKCHGWSRISTHNRDAVHLAMAIGKSLLCFQFKNIYLINIFLLSTCGFVLFNCIIFVLFSVTTCALEKHCIVITILGYSYLPYGSELWLWNVNDWITNFYEAGSSFQHQRGIYLFWYSLNCCFYVGIFIIFLLDLMVIPCFI